MIIKQTSTCGNIGYLLKPIFVRLRHCVYFIFFPSKRNLKLVLVFLYAETLLYFAHDLAGCIDLTQFVKEWIYQVIDHDDLNIYLEELVLED